MPFLALSLTDERGLSTGDAVLVVSLYGGGAFSASLVGGVLTDRIGRRGLLIWALALNAALKLALGIAQPFWLVAAVAATLGFCSNHLYWPAVSAAVADLVPSPSRVRAFGLLHWANAAGAAVAPVIAGIMAGRGYLGLFVADALTTAAFALLIWRRLPETRPAANGSPAATAGHGLGVALRDPLLILVTALTFGFACIWFQRHAALPLDLRAHGLNLLEYGVTLATNGAVAILLSIPVSYQLDRFARGRVLAVAAVLLGTGYGLTGLVDQFPLYVLTVAVWSLGDLIQAPVSSTVALDLAPVQLRGTYQGIYGIAWGMAAFVGPALGGLVLERWGAGALWASCWVLGGALALGFAAISTPMRHRTAIYRH